MIRWRRRWQLLELAITVTSIKTVQTSVQDYNPRMRQKGAQQGCNRKGRGLAATQKKACTLVLIVIGLRVQVN
jgi:hypothetical protein